MKTREIFEIVVKTAGLIVLLYGAEHFLCWIMSIINLYETKYTQYHIALGIIMVTAGLLIMSGVIPLTDIAYYPEEEEEGEEEEEEEEEGQNSLAQDTQPKSEHEKDIT